MVTNFPLLDVIVGPGESVCMHDFLNSLWLTVQPALLTLISGLVLLLIAQATLWVRAHTKNTQFEGIVERATSDISAFVAKQAQRIDQFRGEDGKLDEAEAKLAKDAVMTDLKAVWNAGNIMAELKHVLGIDNGKLDSWISAKVEEAVRSIRPMTTTQLLAGSTTNPAGDTTAVAASTTTTTTTNTEQPK